jgi:Lipocalin-like domain
LNQFYIQIKTVLEMKNVFATRYGLVIAAISFIALACDKDEEQSKTDLLTAKGWKHTKVEIKFGNAPEVDVTAESDFLENCEKDNVITFAKDKTYDAQVGSDDCNGDESGGSGTWAWQSNETTLSMTSDGYTDNFPVVSLTETTLKLNLGTSEYDIDGDGIDDEVTVFYSFSH